MERNTKKAPKLLLILVIGWIPLWIFDRLLASSWFSIGFFSDFLITILVTLAGLVLLILSIVVVILSSFRWLTRRERPHVATFLLLVITLVIYFLPMRIPSRKEMTFYHHRDEFIEFVDSSISELQDTDKRGFRLRESPLYEDASIYRELSSETLVLEFIVSDYYLPLMYISTDDPAGTHGACFGDGGPIERLEPKWYVCRRDWN